MVQVSLIDSDNETKLFPNLAVDQLTIDMDSKEIQSIQLFNQTEQLLKSYRVPNANKKQIDISHLSHGLYMAKIQVNNGQLFEKFIIKNII